MATGNVIVTVVDVGQGQCTFVEIYDDSLVPVLLHTLLFDCGTNKSSPSESVNLDYIVDRVSGMALPTFDCIFFSHSDTDHTNLTRKLLLLFPPAKKPKVKKVWYGGDVEHYTVIEKKVLFNILTYLVLENYCLATDILSPDPDFSNYTSPNSWTGELWKMGDGTTNVQVYSIIANVLKAVPEDPFAGGLPPDKKAKRAESANRVSIVCALYYAGASYVICGDATNKTMAEINKKFIGGTTVFNNNQMTTAPHHGSRTTGFAVSSSAAASVIAANTVTGFATLLKSQTITVSAYDHHGHPSLELLNSFIPTITTPFLKDTRFTENTHRIVVFNNSNNSIELKNASGIKLFTGYYTFDTPTCIFPTWYSVFAISSYKFGEAVVGAASAPVDPFKPIDPNACWQYVVKADGNWTVGGYANLKLPLVLFTGPITTSLADKASPIMVETKTAMLESIKPEIQQRVQKLRLPAHGMPQLRSHIKQFH
jgi:hypothetical protein